MVVDDEEDLSSLYGSLIRSCGFESVSFTDPLLALDYFRQHPGKFSLVITDLRMPGLNGLELAKSIRDFDTSVKIILISAFYTEKNLMSIDNQGAEISLVIRKPVHMSVLLNHIKDLCYQ